MFQTSWAISTLSNTNFKEKTYHKSPIKLNDHFLKKIQTWQGITTPKVKWSL